MVDCSHTTGKRTSQPGMRRVVKPFCQSNTFFTKTSKDTLDPKTGYNDATRKPERGSSSIDRNFMRASESRLSQQRHGEAQLFYREIRAALHHDKLLQALQEYSRREIPTFMSAPMTSVGTAKQTVSEELAQSSQKGFYQSATQPARQSIKR